MDSDEYAHFSYEGLNQLVRDNIPEDADKVVLCAFSINRQMRLPFLQFFTFRDENDILTFPRIKTENADIAVTNIINCFDKSIIPSKDVDNEVMCCYEGYYMYNGECYAFYDMSKFQIDTHYLLSDWNDVIIVTMNEIVNTNMCAGLEIDDTVVVSFFLDNQNFIYLKNTEFDEIVETPSIAYIKCPRKKMEFIASFGINKCAYKNSLVSNRLANIDGEVWGYFFDANIPSACLKDEVVIRFCVFLGFTNMIFGTNKMVTVDDLYNAGKTTDYDSTYVNGQVLVVNKFEQFYPLTIHKRMTQRPV